jgi:hypothetical protein
MAQNNEIPMVSVIKVNETLQRVPFCWYPGYTPLCGRQGHRNILGVSNR